jgi:multimeric flavodoxin WrbA
MKLLGLICGRKNGNSEILLKEAMMGAEEATSVKIEMIRLHDLDIHYCTGCLACGKNAEEKCIHKDDFPFFEEKFFNCDGIIINTPVYVLTPPGYFRVLCDRIGPNHDLGFKIEQKKLKGDEYKIDERYFKSRVAGFMAVGGSPVSNWVPLALPMLHLLTFPMDIKVVDQLQVLGALLPGQVLLNDKAVSRARELGRHVAEEMEKPKENVKWRGEENEGTCPVCHSNLMVVGKESPVECAVCGIKGWLKEDNGKISVTFPMEEQAVSRLTIDGKSKHYFEIVDLLREFDRVKGKEIINQKIGKYLNYKPITKPAGAGK